MFLVDLIAALKRKTSAEASNLGTTPQADSPPPPSLSPIRVPTASVISPRTVEIIHDDGTVETRSEGTRSWRNNNPTNLRYGREEVARRNGAIGFDADGFAIFPNERTGKRAALASLGSPAYQARTLGEAIAKWAPPFENDTAAYQRFVETQMGLPGETRLNALTPTQMERLYEVIKRFEGWQPGRIAMG